MTSEGLARLNGVFQELFEDDELVVGPETTARDVEGWDSVMHVRLLLGVEAAFGVRFSSAQVASLKNVGQLMELIDAQAG